MGNQRFEKLIGILAEFRDTVDMQVAKKLELDKCEQVIKRLGSFSSDCEECNQHLIELENHMIQLNDKLEQLEENDFKHHKHILSNIISHLQKQHKLVTEGFYLSIYMSLGTSLGLVFGLTLFDNVGLGLPIGICIGVAIGLSLDADAKKKGLTL